MPGQRLLERASADPATAEQSELFSKLIVNDIHELKEIKKSIEQQAAEMKPVNDLIHEFNAVMADLKPGSIRTIGDIERFENRFNTIKQKIRKMQAGRLSAANREYLTEFMVAVDENLGYVTETRNSPVFLINKCVESFTSFMDNLEARKIRTKADLTNAKNRLSTLKGECTTASRLIASTATAEDRRVMTDVIQAIYNVQQQLDAISPYSLPY